MKHAVDLIVPVGTPVRAAAGGRVAGTYVETNGELYLELKHSGGKWTGYGHLSKFLLKKGQKVRRGQVIGVSGDTGDLAHLPPHVHFEVDITSGKSWKTVPFCWRKP